MNRINSSQRLGHLSAKHKRVVAVVGAAHVPGVAKFFAENTLMFQINVEGKALRGSTLRAISAKPEAAQASEEAVRECCRLAFRVPFLATK